MCRQYKQAGISTPRLAPLPAAAPDTARLGTPTAASSCAAASSPPRTTMEPSMMDVCEGEPYIDQNKRIMTVQRIVCFLARLENKDPQDRRLYELAEAFEDRIFSRATSMREYNTRMMRRLLRARKSRLQQRYQQEILAQQRSAQQSLLLSSPSRARNPEADAVNFGDRLR